MGLFLNHCGVAFGLTNMRRWRMTTRFFDGASFMTRPSPDLYQVDRLTDAQVAQFKRDGLLVLPGVLDLDLCRRDRRVGYDGWAVPDDRGQCGGNAHPSGLGLAGGPAGPPASPSRCGCPKPDLCG